MCSLAPCAAAIADVLCNTPAEPPFRFLIADILPSQTEHSALDVPPSLRLLGLSPPPPPTPLFALLPAVFGCEPVALAHAHTAKVPFPPFRATVASNYVRRQSASQEDPVDLRTHTHRQNVELNPRYIIFPL